MTKEFKIGDKVLITGSTPASMFRRDRIGTVIQDLGPGGAFDSWFHIEYPKKEFYSHLPSELNLISRKQCRSYPGSAQG